METSPERQLYILCTCSYLLDKRIDAASKPQVVSIQNMRMTDKLKVNGYSWLRQANLIWLDLDEFRKLYPDNWKVLIGKYSQDRLKLITSLVVTD